jgi:hypothetical protein
MLFAAWFDEIATSFFARAERVSRPFRFDKPNYSGDRAQRFKRNFDVIVRSGDESVSHSLHSFAERALVSI